jgi:hypothetical protein
LNNEALWSPPFLCWVDAPPTLSSSFPMPGLLNLSSLFLSSRFLYKSSSARIALSPSIMASMRVASFLYFSSLFFSVFSPVSLALLKALN